MFGNSNQSILMQIIIKKLFCKHSKLHKNDDEGGGGGLLKFHVSLSASF
jgi:hypothetical protein